MREMKNIKKIEQSGRSMIEMLGVLAIIAVLSVGGIAGYTRAMSKYNFERSQEQLATLVINTRAAFSSAPNYANLDNDTAYALNIIPLDMLPKSTSGTSDIKIIHAFSGIVTLDTANDDKNFSVQFDSLSTEICANLAAADWKAEDLNQISINGEVFEREDLPISLVSAVNACNAEGYTNSIIWEFF